MNQAVVQCKQVVVQCACCMKWYISTPTKPVVSGRKWNYIRCKLQNDICDSMLLITVFWGEYTGMRIFRFKPEFRFFLDQNLRNFIYFQPLLGVFAQFHTLFQVFSPSSGFDMKVHSHAWLYEDQTAKCQVQSCFVLFFIETAKFTTLQSPFAINC